MIPIGVGLEAELEVAGERRGQDDLRRACGYEYGVGYFAVLVVEIEGVVTRSCRHGDDVVGHVNVPGADR